MLLVVSPLLALAIFYDPPFKIAAESSVELVLDDGEEPGFLICKKSRLKWGDKNFNIIYKSLSVDNKRCNVNDQHYNIKKKHCNVDDQRCNLDKPSLIILITTLILLIFAP